MGFFSIQKTDVIIKGKNCSSCYLNKSGANTKFVGTGKNKVLILLDYPRPGESNSYENIITQRMYNILHNMYNGQRGMPNDIFDSWVGYTIPCPAYPMVNSTCCLDRLNELIFDIKPNVIIPIGKIPTEALIISRLSGRIKKVKVEDFYGKQIPDRYYNAWICPTYSIDYIDGLTSDKVPLMYFRQHIRKAYQLQNVSLPQIPNDIKTYGDGDSAAKAINEILMKAEKGELDSAPDGKLDVAIDYETTGIKPHRDGHKIVAASVAYRENGTYKAIGFKWDSKCKYLVDTWYKLTHNPKIGLVAHKADFEAIWTRFRAGYNDTESNWPTNWSWDTCLCAHVINNNQKVGLKFHTYCELGVLGYDTSVDTYLSTRLPGEDKKSKNAFNLLKSNLGIPWGDLVYYCAQDSLYTIYIRDAQHTQVEPTMDAFRFFMDGMVALAKVQSEGLPIDLSKINELEKYMDDKWQENYDVIVACPEVKKWCELNPTTKFNPASGKQLENILFDICKIKPPTGVRDTTDDTLSKIGTPLCTAIQGIRRWSRMKDTFLDGYKREAVYDSTTNCHLIRPFFNLSTGAGGDPGPATFRSSSDSPNFQNIPKRDKEMKSILRSLFIAPPGYRFMEFDYKSLEVMISTSYHNDPSMINYLLDSTSDMHRDTACDMYIKTPDTLSKEERNSIKAGYVFSSFYGASYKSCAQNMWNNMPKTAKDHITSLGINSYSKWEDHVRKADDIFWNKRFKVYNEWRHTEYDNYQANGYVQSKTGFRCYGPMGFTETVNRSIQGSAFHVLLWALIHDIIDLEKLNIKSKIIGQIHDALIWLVADGEEDLVASLVYRNGVELVSQYFKWISVPLVCESESSKLGGSWAEMVETGPVCSTGFVNKSLP